MFNCNAPDSGDMEVLLHYGSEAQKSRWLEPLLAGQIRSGVRDDRAGGRVVGCDQHRDAHEREGDEYVINGRKWWTSGAGDPRCAVYIVMGKTDPEAPKHSQQSMILVPARRQASRSCGR